MPERERQESGDDAEDKDEDVEMENEDQDEIDRLVRESKRTAGGASDDDVDMTDAKPSRTQTRSGSDRERTAPDHKVAFGSSTRNSRKKRTSELPKNKNMTKSKEKPGSSYHYGQRGRSRHLSFNVSTSLRTRMQLTALQEQ